MSATMKQLLTEAPAVRQPERRLVKEKKSKATKPKTAARHPPYFEMIKEALLALNNPWGSSSYAIAKYVGQKYKAVLAANFRKILVNQLKNSAARGKLIKIKASYMLANVVKPAKKQEEEEEELKSLRPYIRNRLKKGTLEEKEAQEAFRFRFWAPTRPALKEYGPEDFEKYPSLFEPYLPSQKKRVIMTMELWERCMKYEKELFESEGFEIDLDNFPWKSSPLYTAYGISFWPCNVAYKGLTDLCTKAISRFNYLNGSHYRFVKVVKANVVASANSTFYITFQARKSPSDSLVTFQTCASSPIKPLRSKIRFCRVKKDTRGGPMDGNIGSRNKAEQAAAAGPSETTQLL